MRVPWTARRSNQSLLKEINSEYSLEGLVLNLKLQYFDHLMGRTDSLEKTLMLGKIVGRRRRDKQRMRLLDGITGSLAMSLSKPRKIMKDREAWRAQSMGLQRVGHDLVNEQQKKNKQNRLGGNKKLLWKGASSIYNRSSFHCHCYL